MGLLALKLKQCLTRSIRIRTRYKLNSSPAQGRRVLQPCSSGDRIRHRYTSSPVPNTLAHTDKDFETSPLNEFPCGVKTEPFESLNSQSTNANTSVYSPLPHCTSQLLAATDINHKSDPKVFSISNSTDLESAKRMKLKAKTLQVSLSKKSQNVLKTSFLNQA